MSYTDFNLQSDVYPYKPHQLRPFCRHWPLTSSWSNSLYVVFRSYQFWWFLVTVYQWRRSSCWTCIDVVIYEGLAESADLSVWRDYLVLNFSAAVKFVCKNVSNCRLHIWTNIRFITKNRRLGNTMGIICWKMFVDGSCRWALNTVFFSCPHNKTGATEVLTPVELAAFKHVALKRNVFPPSHTHTTLQCRRRNKPLHTCIQ